MKLTILMIYKFQTFRRIQMKYITKLNKAALTIKAKHLAEESRIIRREERKWKGHDKLFFSEHRKGIVRNEARATQLAIAMMVGKPYEAVERKCNNKGKLNWFIVPRIAAMVEKYHKPSEEIRTAMNLSRYQYKNSNDTKKRFFQAAVKRWIDGKDPFKKI